MRRMLLALCAPGLAWAGPQVLAHSGRAVGADGAPLNELATVTFSLVDAAAAVRWTETRSVRFEDGVYAAPLGTLTPLDPSVLGEGLTVVAAIGAAEVDRRPLAAAPRALAVDGAVRVSAAPALCTSAHHGALRWSGGRIELCGPSDWQPIQPVATASKFRGYRYAQSNANGLYPNAIPWDDTVPQITEGNELLSLTHTAKAVGNRLVFEGTVNWAEPSNHSDYFTVALFRVGTASALATAVDGASNGNARCTANGTYGQICTMPFQFTTTATSTAAQTYTLRVGLNGGNVAINRGEGGRRLGGTLYNTLSVTEYAP